MQEHLNSRRFGLSREARTLVREAKRQKLAEEDLALLKTELLSSVTGVSQEVRGRLHPLCVCFQATFRAMHSRFGTRSSKGFFFSDTAVEPLDIALRSWRIA